jgi:uncharacterized protein (DUF3820 family)
MNCGKYRGKLIIDVKGAVLKKEQKKKDRAKAEAQGK